MRNHFLLLAFLPVFLAGCSSGGGESPFPPGLRIRPEPELHPRGIDWGADVLRPSPGLTLDRVGFESYLCQRFAAGWIEGRGVVRLLAAGTWGHAPAAVGMQKMILVRSHLAGSLNLEEEDLRRRLLALGWGELRLLRTLELRFLVHRAWEADRLPLPGSFPPAPPPLQPRTISGLRQDGLARAARHLAAAVPAPPLRFALDDGGGDPRALLRRGGRPVVELEEGMLLDILAVITPVERLRALREHRLLWLAAQHLGRPLPPGPPTRAAGDDAAPARALHRRLQAAWLAAGPAAPGPELAAAAGRAAGMERRAELHLVPALRAATGRPGKVGQLVRAWSRAEKLRTRFRQGVSSPAREAEADREQPEPIRARCAAVRTLGEGWFDLAAARRVLGGGDQEALGLGCDPALWLMLLPEKGAWTALPCRWGVLLARGGPSRPVAGKGPSPGEVLGRLRFLAWVRRLEEE